MVVLLGHVALAGWDFPTLPPETNAPSTRASSPSSSPPLTTRFFPTLPTETAAPETTEEARLITSAPKAKSSLSAGQVALYLGADVILLCFAALFAGLTLSIMGLDTLSLEIIADSGSEPDKTYARKILPIRQKGNQLLCTLILGNVMVNTLIAQLTDKVFTGWVATTMSTALITLGGEIIPQATMSAHALFVGSKSAPVVKLFLFLFFPICKPLALFLDKVIGADPGQIYERQELKKLMVMHAHEHGQESGLGVGEANLMVGALEIHEKNVTDVMKPLHEVFMLEASTVLDEATLQQIWEKGHSRIPIYRIHRTQVVGVLFTKDLLGLRPEEGTPLMTLVRFYGRTCHVIPSETKLVSLLKYFQSGKSHLAFVQGISDANRSGDPVYELQGIVTLEDVIEELIHGEIWDEYDEESSDEENDGKHHLTSLTSNILSSVGAVRRSALSQTQTKACALFLHEEVPQFKILTAELVMDMVAKEGVVCECRPKDNARALSTADRRNIWLYRCGVPATCFTLIISGRAQVIMGDTASPSKSKDLPAETGYETVADIVIELPSWSIVGRAALTATPSQLPATSKGPQKPHHHHHHEVLSFIPDYSCRVVTNTKVLQISADVFQRYARKAAAAQYPNPPKSPAARPLTPTTA